MLQPNVDLAHSLLTKWTGQWIHPAFDSNVGVLRCLFRPLLHLLSSSHLSGCLRHRWQNDVHCQVLDFILQLLWRHAEAARSRGRCGEATRRETEVEKHREVQGYVEEEKERKLWWEPRVRKENTGAWWKPWMSDRSTMKAGQRKRKQREPVKAEGKEETWTNPLFVWNRIRNLWLTPFIRRWALSQLNSLHAHTSTHGQGLSIRPVRQMRECRFRWFSRLYHQRDQRWTETKEHLFTLDQFAAVLQFFFRTGDSTLALYQAADN